MSLLIIIPMRALKKRRGYCNPLRPSTTFIIRYSLDQNQGGHLLDVEPICLKLMIFLKDLKKNFYKSADDVKHMQN